MMPTFIYAQALPIAGLMDVSLDIPRAPSWWILNWAHWKAKMDFRASTGQNKAKTGGSFFFSTYSCFFSLLSSPPAPNEAFWEGKWRRARYELCVYIFFSGYDGALSLEVLTKIIGFVWKKLGWINGWSKG